MSVEVTIQDDAPSAHNPSDAQFQHWVDSTFEHVTNAPTKGEITIKIINEEESAVLNQTFRDKEGPTNVLSFSYDDIDEVFTGDIAICANLVAKEACEQEKPVEAHWAHLVIHGTLHLMGYDHIDDNDATIMERTEQTIMNALGYENPYD